jgi:integrase
MATLKIIIRTDQPKKNGECQLSIRVTKDRKKSEMALGYYIQPNDWDNAKECPKKKYGNFHDLAIFILSLRTKFNEVLLELNKKNEPFGSTDIIKKLKPQKSDPNTVFSFCESHINRVRTQERISTASIFKSTLNRFKIFRNNIDLPFSELTPLTISDFETWLLSGGIAKNSAFVYLRTLKTFINEAKKLEIVPESFNPFKGKSFAEYRRIKTKKRALTQEQIEILKNTDFSYNEKHKLAMDIFLFSYYARGMNFNDIAKLKWSDLINDKINYTRSKTNTPFIIGINQNIKLILDVYKKTRVNNNSYVFPILSEKHKTPTQQENRIDKVLKQINKNYKEIGDRLNIPAFTTYAARHTFATLAQKRGVNISLIKEALGHSSEDITRVYLEGIDNSALDKEFEHI